MKHLNTNYTNYINEKIFNFNKDYELDTFLTNLLNDIKSNFNIKKLELKYDEDEKGYIYQHDNLTIQIDSESYNKIFIDGKLISRNLFSNSIFKEFNSFFKNKENEKYQYDDTEFISKFKNKYSKFF